jgi:Tfp pilus assembly protein PilO
VRLADSLDVFDRWGATAGLVVAAIAYCAFIDMPYGKETAQLRSETAQRRDFIAKAAKLVEETANSKREGQTSVNYVKSWEAATPKAADVGTFFSDVHQAARRAGATVARFEPQPPISLVSIEQRPVALTLEGSHAQIAAALVNIEKLSATIWVKDVVVSRSRVNAENVQFESKLVVFTDKTANSD